MSESEKERTPIQTPQAGRKPENPPTVFLCSGVEQRRSTHHRLPPSLGLEGGTTIT